MILIINICKQNLHYYEFVKPTEDILKKDNIKYFVRHYKELDEKELEKADKIIICGTSLKDNKFLFDISDFFWIKSINKPLLGICGGMQIIGLVFSGNNKKLLKQKTEIGFFDEFFKKDFLGLKNKQKVYHLHNNYFDFLKLNCFRVFSLSDKKIPQAAKHNAKEVYCVLFHPEVRQKDLIIRFVKK